VSKISGISSIFSLLKQQASKVESTKQLSKKNRSAKSNDSDELDNFKTETLPSVISDAVRSIDPTWSQDKQNRQLVRSILAWEFGDEILDDPKFYRLLDGVMATINESEALKKDFQLLFESTSA